VSAPAAGGLPADGDDRTLARLFLGGDEAAFRELYRRHAPAVYAFSTRLSGSAADGEDLLQEAWVRGGARLSGFRWQSSLRTWLCGIAANCWREMRRERGRGDGSRPAADPRAPEGAHGERIDLDRAIRDLPDGYRDVLVLHDLYGYTHEEIGRLLEIRSGTSKSQLSRARAAPARPARRAFRTKRKRRNGGAMTGENEMEWTEEERSALDRLDREMTPPPDAEERIVAALAARGMLGKRRRLLRGPWPWLLAAAAALFGAGLSVGRREGAATRPAPPSRFVLFLFDEGERGGGDRVAEYKAWARGIGSGRYVAGEKLKPGGLWLTDGASGPAADAGPSEKMGGYFVIEAADLAGALAVARSCPHLRHGGRILVRHIDPV
jgi:RNA polymerase sigma-70 factor (ECF subfamily)